MSIGLLTRYGMTKAAGGGGGAGITFEDATTFNGGFLAASFQLTCPATVNANDLLVAAFVYGASNSTNVTWTPPAGWVEAVSPWFSFGGNGGAAMFYKIASGSEDGTTVAFVPSSGQTSSAGAGTVLRYSGANAVTPVTAQAELTKTSYDTSAVQTAALSVPNDGVLLCAWGSFHNIVSWTPAVSMDTRVNHPATSARTICVADELFAVGASVQRAATPSSSTRSFAMTIAISP